MTNLERSLSKGDAKPFELRLTNGELAALLQAIEFANKHNMFPVTPALDNAKTKLLADLDSRI